MALRGCHLLGEGFLYVGQRDLVCRVEEVCIVFITRYKRLILNKSQLGEVIKDHNLTHQRQHTDLLHC